MRATILPRAPRRRGLITGLVTASVLTLSMLAGGTALGANPNWIVGHGTDSAPTAPQPDSGASSSAVGAGRQVGFFEWLRNGDTSNISQLYLTASTTPSATVAGATWTIKNAAGATVRTGVCPAATPLTCSFGALNSGNTVYIVAAFTTPSTLANGATQAVHFEFNTTGTPGGKNNSHGDAKAIDDQVTVTNNGDANGDFNLAQASLTVADDQALQKNRNPQATSVTVNALAVGAAVGDSPTLTTPCNATLTAGFPSFFSCSLLTSLTSTVEVGNGKTFNNANGRRDAGDQGHRLVRQGAVTAERRQQVRLPLLDGHGRRACRARHGDLHDRRRFPSNIGPCLVVGNGNVTVWLTHNGNMRM